MEEKVIIDKSISDEELVRLISKTKSSQLFSILYERYADVIYNKCLSFLKNNEESQDLTHDIFVKLFVKLSTFNHQSKFSTWLYSFTYNHCLNHVQRNMNKRRDKFILTDDISEYSENLLEITDQQIMELKSDKLKKCLDQAEPSDKIILFMKYQDDMTIAEIEEALQIGKSAVKMRLQRAKNRLINIYNTI